MDINEENEFKSLIDEKRYNDILQKINMMSGTDYIDKYTQINYYYDTPDYLLYKNKITLRVRQINDVLLLEVKYLQSSNNGNTKSIEDRSKILRLPKKIHIKDTPLYVLLEKYGLDISDIEFNLLGSLVTDRIEYSIDCSYNGNEVKIFLDKSMYLGKLDYELEVEYIELFETEASNIFSKLIESGTVITVGKKTRFLEAYKNFLITEIY